MDMDVLVGWLLGGLLIAAAVVGLVTGPIWLAFPLLAIPALAVAVYVVWAVGYWIVCAIGELFD